MLSGTIGSTFGQVSRITGSEVTVLTIDEAADWKIFYHPNDELGYVDPETGDLLTTDYMPGTSAVLVLEAVPSGNLSQLVGVHYSNGQLIAADGGNTVYHRDGSIMRSGGVWTYDAGATLESGGNWFWSNGNALKSGGTFKHPNNAIFLSGTIILYANGAAFKDAGTTLHYPSTQTLRDSSGNYFYQSAGSLRQGNVISYSDGAVMVDAAGNVFNDTGTAAITPFTRKQNINGAEYYTQAKNGGADTLVAVENDVGGSFGAYVSKFHVTYQVLPPNVVNIAVTAPDAQSLYFSWASGGGTTAYYSVVPGDGVSPSANPADGVNTTSNFYYVTGLTPGQRVNIRVWANDGAGHLSSGVFATGIAGQLTQPIQTQLLIASALDPTFAQVYDSANQDTVLTIDKNNSSFVFYHVNDELGYVNIDNGDRMVFGNYQVPSTTIIDTGVLDFSVIGNLAQIPSGAHYQSGGVVRKGNIYFYENGAVLRDAFFNWYYANGNLLQNGTGTYWGGGIAMRSGATSRYPNNAVLKSGGNIFYQGGAQFLSATTVFAPVLFADGTTLKTPSGNLLYEGSGANLLANNVFHYPAGATMIDGAGTAYKANGSVATLPFSDSELITTSQANIGIGSDRVAHYSVSIVDDESVMNLGGSVDYAAVNGDFNHNGTVDAADYTVWRDSLGGSFNLSADGNRSGTIDVGDYGVWTGHFGTVLPGARAGSRAATGAEGNSQAHLFAERAGNSDVADTLRVSNGSAGSSVAEVSDLGTGLAAASYSGGARAAEVPAVGQSEMAVEPIMEGDEGTSTAGQASSGTLAGAAGALADSQHGNPAVAPYVVFAFPLAEHLLAIPHADPSSRVPGADNSHDADTLRVSNDAWGVPGAAIISRSETATMAQEDALLVWLAGQDAGARSEDRGASVSLGRETEGGWEKAEQLRILDVGLRIEDFQSATDEAFAGMAVGV
jgi:hypothetical protein